MAGNNNHSGGPDNGGKQPRKQSFMVVLICILISLVCMSFFSGAFSKSSSREITYDRFISMLEKDQIASVEMQDATLRITPKTTGDEVVVEYYTNITEDETALTKRLEKAGVEFSKKPSSMMSEILGALISFLLPFVIIMIIFSIMTNKLSKGGGMMGIGKSRAKNYIQQETGVTFKDVAGEDEAKESLQEVVDFLHNPGKYAAIGAKLPKGALLVGPPGTGKTLLAKAVAGEAKVPFFSLSGSEFVEMFVGVGASRVRDLFEEAKKNAPCIIFIDEIDAIGKRRDSGQYGGNDEREQTLNQLLAEMDGFEASKGLLILAATNRPEVLDPALLRPGRFDRRVIVDRPDLKGREAILKVHSKDVAMDESVDLNAVALATSGAVGSDLANMINEGAILAVKNGRRAVSQKDLLDAVEVVLVGKEKKDRIMSAEERRIVSYHEVGHALLTALQKHTEPVQKITIIPRTMGALGYVMQVPEEEKFLNSKKELEARLVITLGGRAAEEIVFDTVTTGAANDIEQATKIARAMITQFGMSDKFGLMGLASQETQYLGGRAVLNCGDETATEVDHEVMKMLKEAYAKALELLKEHRSSLDRIAEYLINKETITGKEFMKIFNEAEGTVAEDNPKAVITPAVIYAGTDAEKDYPTAQLPIIDESVLGDSLVNGYEFNEDRSPAPASENEEVPAAQVEENTEPENGQYLDEDDAAAEEPIELDIRDEIRPL
ncbi:MAG: ATP-dependent zinc metalloprotease FtsH [Lachnospiraceae bacterium]|nr:ATP-dependent zinc metalloprotease FtsH [Candidatus Equihabitans merdae]